MNFLVLLLRNSSSQDYVCRDVNRTLDEPYNLYRFSPQSSCGKGNDKASSLLLKSTNSESEAKVVIFLKKKKCSYGDGHKHYLLTLGIYYYYYIVCAAKQQLTFVSVVQSLSFLVTTLGGGLCCIPILIL